jgi:hypothetical protein
MIPDPSNEGDGSIFVASNASIDVNDVSWGDPAPTSVNIYAPSAADSFLFIDNDTGSIALGMTRGKSYVFSATGRVKVAVSGTEHPRARRLAILYRDGTGAYQEALSDALPTTVGAVTRVTATVTLPLGTTEAFVRAYLGHTTGEVQWDAFRLSEASLDPTDTSDDFFDGATTDTDTYVYAWNGDANQSTSQRTAVIQRAPESLLWRAGDNALDFLSPVLQAAGFRLVCDEQRAWTLRSDDFLAAGSTSLRYGVNMIGGAANISCDSELWFDARVTRYTWTDWDGNRREAIDAWALDDPYVKLTTLDIDAPYPGPGRSEYAVRRAQGRGRQLSATTVADWRTLAEQPVAVEPQFGTRQVGVVQTVAFNLDDDTMQVTTRTRETPAGAIDNLEGTINALTGTIDGLG